MRRISRREPGGWQAMALRVAVPATIALSACEVSACTFCYGRPAVLVRGRLLDDDIWWNCGAVLLPLLLLASVILLVAREPGDGR